MKTIDMGKRKKISLRFLNIFQLKIKEDFSGKESTRNIGAYGIEEVVWYFNDNLIGTSELISITKMDGHIWA